MDHVAHIFLGIEFETHSQAHRVNNPDLRVQKSKDRLEPPRVPGVSDGGEAWSRARPPPHGNWIMVTTCCPGSGVGSTGRCSNHVN